MKLYLDTADLSEWDALLPLGIFHGITTNPLLAARAGHSYGDMDWPGLARKASALGAKELHAQVFGAPETYVDWAAHLYKAGAAAGIKTVVKIPLVEDAIRQTTAIKALGGPILMTACYDAKQMFLANALGADYIAPYFGRMAEAGMDAVGQIQAMQAMRVDGGCEVMVASLRSTQQMVELAAVGADVFTIAPAIARELLHDENTIGAFEDFETAAAK